MKKSLIALAVLAASGAAFAQSSVTAYGVADVFFGNVNAGGITRNVLNSGGVADSRFGFKGTEDLGGGLKANFKLEQGFSIDNGASIATGPAVNGVTPANQAFSREAYVGFSGGFGEIKLGKMYTAFDDVSGAANSGFDSALSAASFVMVTAGKTSAYSANPGNSISYASPSFSGFTGAVSYSLGENKTAAVDAGSIVSMNVAYAAGPLTAALALQNEKTTDAVNAVKYTALNATYDLGVAKLLAGYGKESAGVDTTEYQIGVNVPVSKALTLSAGYARSTLALATGDVKTSGYGLVGAYSLSKRTLVYGGMHNSTTDGLANSDVIIYAIGVNHAF